ncbi:TonB-dependent receptor [Thalassotalea agarivorans]|uniref:Iron complex outermembrane recepter protein n=1 Tax=Thalassotalea agarivorans TaxID=349064 RepID=A0A1I0ATP9_THASX|nr:TonB-dependent receptor [Thalassotalea agarivorans]SES97733.1 iron complex outermembrane recepter protein [Thalassotalea agarivorans]
MKKSKLANAISAIVTVAATAAALPAFAENISGVVKNSQGEAIANARVSVHAGKHSTVTNEQGEFSLEGIKAEEIELHVEASNYVHVNQSFNLSNGDVSGVSLTMSPTVMEIVDVYSTPLHASSIESAQPINVLAGEELRAKQASTLGETLKYEVGVHSTYYGPVSSSPVIRGLEGGRVVIAQNGLDVGDASRVGPDHVVTTESLTATQIEVLRGPATLFYGSGAIGGVVNIVDHRVPSSSDTEFEWQLGHNTVAEENHAAINLQTGTEKFAFHVDAFWRDADDYKIAGPAELEEDHEEHEAHEGEEHDHEEHGEEGTLENSSSNSHGYTVGASYLLDNGFFGMSYGRLEKEYGIPGHSHGHEEEVHADEHAGEEAEAHEEHEEEGVSAKMVQDRIQFISELGFDGNFINGLNLKAAYTDYQHQEIEEGMVGTSFKNKSSEFRADIFHSPIWGFDGVWSIHAKHSDFEALGEEAFTPPSETTAIALAWIEEKHFGDVLLQLGARVEHVEIDAMPFELEHEEHEGEHAGEEPDAHEEHDHDEDFAHQDYTPVSLSAGIVWDYTQGYNIGLSTSYSQRAPSASELFSAGPHIGTNSYEIGALYEVHEEGEEIHIEPHHGNIELESSANIDLTWRKFEGDFGFVISAYYSQVNDFFYQENTGLYFEEHGHDHGGTEPELVAEEEHHGEEGHEDGLPIYQWVQRDVELYGLEAEVKYRLTDNLTSSLFGDYTVGKLKTGEYLPRISPMRIGGQLTYTAESFDAELGFNHYFEQDKVAVDETTTDAYTLVDARFNYHLGAFDQDIVLYVKAENLLDENARVHTSFIKNVAPLPGRNFGLGIRGSF